MTPLFFVGLGLTGVGGYAFLLGYIVGEIPAKWPFQPISRHDQPDRFAFWLDVSGGVLALGIILLIATGITKLLEWPM